ncbi:MAG: hypothetical protein Q9165_000907 [Trypethelium subeluteriae]
MEHSPSQQQSPRTPSEMLAIFLSKKSEDAANEQAHGEALSQTSFASPSESPKNNPVSSRQRAPAAVSSVASSPSIASPTSSEYTSPLRTELDADSPSRECDPFSTPTASQANRRSLRPRSSLAQPAHLSEYVPWEPRTPRKDRGARKDFSSSPAFRGEPEESADARRLRRDNFLLKYQSLFSPLLQRGNYLEKLLQERRSDADGETDIVPYRRLERQPRGINTILKPHQVEGVSFLLQMHENNMACILGDEMGLGKTLQVLSLFQYIMETQSGPLDVVRPFLVVCPLSVLDQWIREARKFTPDLEPMSFYGSVDIGHVKEQAKRGALNLVITSYETFVAEQAWLKRSKIWEYVVLDEGHRIKNDGSNVAKALQSVKACNRLILTGTPLQNDLHEMWSLLHWLYPDVFTSATEEIFGSSFNLSRGKVSTIVMDDARRLLELVMLRRFKDSPGVDLALPPKNEVQLSVPLTPTQKHWYTKILTGMDPNLRQDVLNGHTKKDAVVLEDEEFALQQTQMLDSVELRGKDEFASQRYQTRGTAGDYTDMSQQKTPRTQNTNPLLNLILQLRKCCNHPYLFPDAVPDPYQPGEHVVKASGKLIVLVKLVEELVVKCAKQILIFSNMTSMLDLCEDILELNGQHGRLFKYVRLDGSTWPARRNLHVRLFNSPQSEYKVFLISTKAGGLGLNLTSATEVIFLDEEWNPQVTLQAEARAHRIGQTKPVTVYKLCTAGTVEEQMLGRIRKKLYLSVKVSPRKSTNEIALAEERAELSSLGSSELKSLLRKGTQTLSHDEVDVNAMLSWDFETMLERCRGNPADVERADAVDDTTLDEEAWLSSIERVESAVFDGHYYKRKRTEPDSSQSLIAPLSKRERKQRTIEVETDMGTFNTSRDDLTNHDAIPSTPTPKQRLQMSNQQRRCRWCDCAYCEGCLEFDQTELLGNELPELKDLDYGAVTQSFYIHCPPCREHHASNPGARAFFQAKEKAFDRLLEPATPKAVDDAATVFPTVPDLSPPARARDGYRPQTTSRDATEVQTPADESSPGPAKPIKEPIVIVLDD